MKKILIITGSFEIGGSRTSLCSLLSVLDSKKVNVDVFAREHVGPLKDNLHNCRILPENIWLSHRIVTGDLASKCICKLLYYLRGSLQKIGVDLFKLYNFIGGKLIESYKYDAVIGFDETLSRYISFIPAKKRIIWLHCDYRRHINGEDETRYLNKIDRIVCVSKYAEETLLEVFPQYKDKTIVINNAINIEDITTKSLLYYPDADRLFEDDKKFTLISIGRLDPVKQFEKIPAIAFEVKRLLNGSHKFQWLIIGGGNESVKSIIVDETEKYGVRDEVKLLGMQSNPYPFLAKSDLYVCTSSSETFSYTIHEGLALEVPFLCNTFPGASESVHVGKDGIILSLDEMPMKIVELMHHPLKVKGCTITNDKLLNDFYNLI